ncbi:MAG: protein kinase domain-containing protein, partial [Thermoanaerobaculia bacterium]
EILGIVGAGGMGEVYRARDPRLGRNVAVKILPAELAREPRFRERFEREAKLISSLNHPNICAVYDVGETVLNGVPVQYFVMEELAGQTLDKYLHKGPLPIDEVVRYGIEIADALDKAHRNQILHRDLKPSNVMITKSGAKLLDFGLAKLVVEALPEAQGYDDGSHSSTADFSEAATPAKPLTAEGAVPGTFAYMSPEQLRGEVPDSRTDVYAMGVTLYEMIGGRHPFAGDNRAVVTAAILRHEPVPLPHLRPDVPPDLEWLVRMCMNRDRNERFQTAHDVMLELRRIANNDSRIRDASAPRRRRVALAWIVVAAAAAALTTAAMVMISRSQRGGGPPQAVRRFTIALPAEAPLLADPAYERFTVSSDGSRIAYVAATKPQQLFLFRLDKHEVAGLAGTEGAIAPFFAPDGESVAFFTTDGKLKKVWLSTGAVVTLGSERSSRGATWGPQDRLVFGETWKPLQSITTSGTSIDTMALNASPTNARWPMFLPDGKHILYTISAVSGDYENARLCLLSLDTGETRVLVDGATYGRYVPTGHLTYFHSGTLFEVRFDLRTLRIAGKPAPLVSDVDSYYGNGLAHYAVANDGALFYLQARAEDAQSELVWVDRRGKVTPMTAIRRSFDEPRLSPDGRRVVVTIGRGPTSDLWVFDLGRDTWVRLTSEGRNTTGLWSPDGKQIAFASSRSGGFKLFLTPPDRNTPPRQMTTRTSWAFPLSWSPDGRILAIQELFRRPDSDVLLLNTENGELSPMLTRPVNESWAAIAPDGRWVAYQSDESGRDEIYIQPYPKTGAPRLVSTAGGSLPSWRRDGGELFYRSDSKMMAVEIVSGEIGKPRQLFEGDFEAAYDADDDGSRFVMVQRAQGTPRTHINVITGLFQQAK